MKNFLLIAGMLFVCFGCINNRTKYHKLDLHNFLVDISIWDYSDHFNRIFQESINFDSVQHREIIALHSSTQQLLELISNLETQIVNASGGVDVNNAYMNPNSIEGVRLIMKGRNMTNVLYSKLNEYSFLLKDYGLRYAKIAIDPPKHKVLRNDPYIGTNTFEQLHFEDVSLRECMLTLNMYRNIILLKEALTINIILLDKNPSNTIL